MDIYGEDEATAPPPTHGTTRATDGTQPTVEEAQPYPSRRRHDVATPTPIAFAADEYTPRRLLLERKTGRMVRVGVLYLRLTPSGYGRHLVIPDVTVIN